MSHPAFISDAIAVYHDLAASRELLADRLVTFHVEELHLRRGLRALDAIDQAIDATERFLDPLAPGWDEEDDESTGGGG